MPRLHAVDRTGCSRGGIVRSGHAEGVCGRVPGKRQNNVGTALDLAEMGEIKRERAALAPRNRRRLTGSCCRKQHTRPRLSLQKAYDGGDTGRERSEERRVGKECRS